MSTPCSAERISASFHPGLFEGQTIIVIGGTSGIGAATASMFHSLKANVIVAGLAAGTAPLVNDDRMSVRELDVTDHDGITKFLGGLERLDHLVLCAGISLNDAEWGIEAFLKVLDVNLVSGMVAAMAAAPLLASTKGSIVTVASMYAYFGASERPAYSASKGGLVQLTKSIAQQFAADGIRVNAVAPGWIETPLARNLDETTRAEIMKRIPASRWGDSVEVAATITFLCSPAASYVTGAVLPVDGGYLTR